MNVEGYYLDSQREKKLKSSLIISGHMSLSVKYWQGRSQKEKIWSRQCMKKITPEAMRMATFYS